MKNKIFTIFLVLPVLAFSQNRNSIWCFGDSAGIDFRNVQNPVPVSSIVRSRSDCASIADENGNLLFYVGCDTTLIFLGGHVYNKNHDQMPSGSGLITGDWNHEMIIVPVPGETGKYYLFHTAITSGYLGIYYSMVDMSLDSGNGDVTQANINLTQQSVLDGVGAVRHANGRDWWLIYAMNHNGTPENEFYLYLITPAGISSPNAINMGGNFITNAGDIVFSNDGEKMLFTTITGLIEVMDFDRCNGTFSNVEIVEPESPSTRAIASGEFSPDKNLIYISSNDYTSYIYQYDLRANPINSSLDTIAEFSILHNSSGMLRLAPDNKIYLSNARTNQTTFFFPYPDSIYDQYNMNVSVISSPDSIGAACNFQPYSFYLGGKRTYFGLPNNPNYELGPVQGSVCDSLISVTEFTEQKGFSIFPNPFYNKISLHSFHPGSENAIIEIENDLGEIIYSREIILIDQAIDLSFLAKGVYFLRLSGNNFSAVRRLVHL
jgi:hypothetical protein